jgi:tetratricopeptide (TPR) repeat protein
VRWPWVFSIVLGAATAADARPGGDFWKDVIEPHADEVNAIVGKARELMHVPQHELRNDVEWAVDERAKFFREARAMLAHARELSPKHVEVLALYGRAADELGDTAAARDALEACARVTGSDKVPIEVAGRLGAIYMRLGDHDAALRWLRAAQGTLSVVSVEPLINLASLYAARGDTTKAIDVLANAIPSPMIRSYGDELTLATFALAVLYDRDEQRAAAFAVLDRMRSTMEGSYARDVQGELVKVRLAHPEDIHYYRALLYESIGQYIEARAEWAHYAAHGDTPWRRRALEHIALIDAGRRAKPTGRQP